MGIVINHVKKPKVIPRKNIKILASEITDLYENNQFEGKKCLILGGGPSLLDFDPNTISDQFCVGVNKAFLKFSPQINYSMDDNFYDYVFMDLNQSKEQTLTHKSWKNFSGIKIFLRRNLKYKFDPSIYWVKPLGFKAISYVLSKGIWPGTNSAFGATMLAVALGFKKIGLLGVDLYITREGKKKRTHFHGGYPKQDPKKLEKKFDLFISEWNEFASAFKEDGIQIFNLNSKSNLRCFPIIDLEDFKKYEG